MNLKRTLGLLFILLVAASSARASSLTLTSQGSALGFTLTTFASGFTHDSFGFGVAGVTSTSSLNVLVANFGGFPRGVYSLNNIDNQTVQFCGGPSTAGNPGCDAVKITPSTSTAKYFGLANSGGKVYGYSNTLSPTLDLLNDDGTTNTSLALVDFVTGLPRTIIGAEGMATNPIDQHIYMATRSEILDVDPVAKTVRTVTAVTNGDGLTVSPDGKTVYVAVPLGILGFDTQTGVEVFRHLMNNADGIAIIQGTTFFPGGPPFLQSFLAGQLIVNGTDGALTLIDPNTLVSPNIYKSTLIASDPSTRGDLVGYDLTTSTLFLTTSDSIERLSCPGCEFTTLPPPPDEEPTPVPEPISISLIGLGLAGLELVRRKR